MSLEITTKTLLKKHLLGGEAFIPITEVISEIPFQKVGERPFSLPYSCYELLYHITYAQKDILDYCISADYKTPKWPDDYWPSKTAPENTIEWEQLQKKYIEDRKQLEHLIDDKELTTEVSLESKHTLLRELLLVIEHTAYHTGQLVVLARLLNQYSS